MKRLAITLITIALFAQISAAQELSTEQAILTSAPNVPPAITRTTPAKVVVDLEVKEVEGQLADGVSYVFWTFGGEVPGKFIRIREGDTVEFHLANNPSSKLPHNIDLHAVTGPGGGAANSFTAPGHKSRFTFKALNAGLYVYHCATAPVGMHIANGMYGLIYVQPKDPLPKVDREYYIMQSEFYTSGANGEKGLQPFSMDKAIDERPTYVVFNGSTSSTTGERAIKANVGETVRLFVGNGGPNLISSFHVIGEIFDNVYGEGGTVLNQHNVQTTLVPAGGSAIVEFKVDVPGTLVLVDHSIFRAFNKGAIGMLKVAGQENKAIYSGKEVDETYLGDTGSSANKEAAAIKAEYDKAIAADPKLQKLGKDLLMVQGKKVYVSTCSMCHQLEGQGIPGVFPNLAKSDYLAKLSSGKNREGLIGIIQKGLSGSIKVNGVDFNGVMPALANLSDEEASAVLTYITNSWGNSAATVSAEEVKNIRRTMKEESSQPEH